MRQERRDPSESLIGGFLVRLATACVAIGGVLGLFAGTVTATRLAVSVAGALAVELAGAFTGGMVFMYALMNVRPRRDAAGDGDAAGAAAPGRLTVSPRL